MSKLVQTMTIGYIYMNYLPSQILSRWIRTICLSINLGRRKENVRRDSPLEFTMFPCSDGMAEIAIIFYKSGSYEGGCTMLHFNKTIHIPIRSHILVGSIPTEWLISASVSGRTCVLRRYFLYLLTQPGDVFNRMLICFRPACHRWYPAENIPKGCVNPHVPESKVGSHPDGGMINPWSDDQGPHSSHVYSNCWWLTQLKFPHDGIQYYLIM